MDDIMRVAISMLGCLAVAAGCGGAQSASVARGVPTESKAVLLARFRADYIFGDLPRALITIEAIAQRPDATAKDVGALGDVLAQLGHLDRAEASYRRAVEMDADDVSLTLSLANLLVVAGKDADVIQLLAPIIRSRSETSQDIASIETLGTAYIRVGDSSSACRVGVLGVLIYPRSQPAWDAVEACTPDTARASVAASSLATATPGFTDVLRAGPAGRWSSADYDQHIAMYRAFAAALDAAGEHVIARRYLETCAIVVVFDGVALARAKEPRRSLERFTLAERLYGLRDLSLEHHLAALRDMIVGYVRIRRYLEAAEVAGRLFALCHPRGSPPDRCPLVAIDIPMFASQVANGTESDALLVHVAHVGLVLRDARASVSFDLDAGRPRFADGHDFVGETVAHVGHGARTGTTPYATVSPEEDRVLCLTAANDPDLPDRLQRELDANRFELPVKLLLSQLTFFAMLGAPTGAEVVDDDVFNGVSLEDMRRRILAAPSGTVPEATQVAFEVADRAVALFREYRLSIEHRTSAAPATEP
jgi:tetratricopeptide (TPR) repeat protein